MKLIKVHRVVEFQQGDFLKSWVDFCTQKRAEAKDSFTRNFWKMMVNAVYGKTIENLLKRVHVKICRSKEELLQAVSKKTYKRQIIVNEELVIVTQEKPIVFINKPYYIGFSILDISKYIMYDYFYNTLRPYFGNYKDVQLLYSDTDSFILKIKSNDLISDLKNLSPTFDFSNLPMNHPLFDDSKKSKLFHFKEEFGLLPILRVVCLGSKVYSIQTVCCHDFKLHSCQKCKTNPLLVKDKDNISDKLVMKGISKQARTKFTFQDYFCCLQKQLARRTIDYQIQSKNQKLSSNVIQKVALSGFCDKRYILECGVHSIPFNNDIYNDKCTAEECM